MYMLSFPRWSEPWIANSASSIYRFIETFQFIDHNAIYGRMTNTRECSVCIAMSLSIWRSSKKSAGFIRMRNIITRNCVQAVIHDIVQPRSHPWYRSTTKPSLRNKTIHQWNHPTMKLFNQEIIKPWNNPTTKSSNHEIIQPWNHPIMRSSNHEIIQSWNHSITKLSNHETTKSWNYPTMKSSNPEIIQSQNHPTIKSFNHELIQTWNHPIMNSSKHEITHQWYHTTLKLSFNKLAPWNSPNNKPAETVRSRRLRKLGRRGTCT